MAQAKTKLQREQKLWELQRPPAGPINTYKCLSKQSLHDGDFAEWVLSLTPEIAAPLRKTGLGCDLTQGKDKHPILKGESSQILTIIKKIKNYNNKNTKKPYLYNNKNENKKQQIS